MHLFALTNYQKGQLNLLGPRPDAVLERVIATAQPLDAQMRVVAVIAQVVRLDIGIAAHLARLGDELATSDRGAGSRANAILTWISRRRRRGAGGFPRAILAGRSDT